MLPSVPRGSVPSFGGGLVPRVCEETLWLAAEVAAAAVGAALADEALGALAAAETGNGVDDEALGGVACTVLPVVRADSAPGAAPRSQPVAASAARQSSADEEVADARGVMASALATRVPGGPRTPPRSASP